jgi:hypothetical protein
MIAKTSCQHCGENSLKTLLLFIMVSISATAQTNKIIQVNLPTNLIYGGDFGGGINDNSPKSITLIVQWQINHPEDNRIERFNAKIENYPFVRPQWHFTQINPNPNEPGYWNPIQPIKGTVKVLEEKNIFDNLGKPDRHAMRYLWITNSIEPTRNRDKEDYQPPATRSAQKQAAAARVLKMNQDAAAKGDAYGLLRMGERYRDGDGVEKDLAKAKEYFQKAADAGSPTAAEELSKLKP